MKASIGRANRIIRHDHRWSDLEFINRVRAVLRLEPINGYDVEEMSYADAWPVQSDGCRHVGVRVSEGR